jgi:hypothetical protein
MLEIIVIVAFVAAAIVNLITTAQLRLHRRDLSPGQSVFEGSSAIWQANVLNPDNYTEPGRQLLRRLVIGLVVQGLAGAVWVFAPR